MTQGAVDPFRIDIHQHPVSKLYRDRLSAVGVRGSGDRPWPDWSVATTLEVMDRTAIEGIVLSIGSPGVFFGDRAFARGLARVLNEELAQLVADRPRRFGAFAATPLPDLDASIAEVAYAFDTLKLDGVCLLAHYDGCYLGDPYFDPFLAELDRRRAVLFIHPAYPPVTGLPKYDAPPGTLELVFDTSRAIANLLYNGTLTRFPNIRVIPGHCAGVAPYVLFRILKFDAMPGIAERNPDGVMACFRRLYYDVTQSAVPATLRSVMEVADPSRILFGSDYPFARFPVKDLEETIAGVESFDGFDAAQRRAIFRDNAIALFPRFMT